MPLRPEEFDELEDEHDRHPYAVRRAEPMYGRFDRDTASWEIANLHSDEPGLKEILQAWGTFDLDETQFSRLRLHDAFSHLAALRRKQPPVRVRARRLVEVQSFIVCRRS